VGSLVAGATRFRRDRQSAAGLELARRIFRANINRER
jgi:hypothetical protein